MTWFVNYGEVGESGPTAPTIEQREDQVVPTANQLAGQPHEVWRVRLPFCDSAAGFARPLDGLYHLAASHSILRGAVGKKSNASRLVPTKLPSRRDCDGRTL